MSKKQGAQPKPFDFLKGKDEQFQQSMGTLGEMYDYMFGDSQEYDYKFQTFKTQNNPITASIDEMTKDIFDLDQPKNEKYVKIQPKTEQKININDQQDDEQSVVFGEPIYMGGYQQINQPKKYN